ncbi:MAG TPA: ATP-binding protein [Cyclobacteriaceae bacterium]|nr:ATP-binding protein [Cyclobacteriaceae bacterium]
MQASIAGELLRSLKTEESVRLAYTLLQSSMESLKDILIFSIDKNYLYLNYNSAFKTATKHAYGTEVAIGVSVLESITDEMERSKVKLNCDRAMTGESHFTVEVYGSLNQSYFETRYNPIINDNDQVIGVTILSTNVTEREKAKEQIMSLNKELEAFSYSVAHDLRAPLRIISGYSGVLMEDHFQNLNEECQHLLMKISGNVTKMGQLIEDLLNFSKLGRMALTRRTVGMEHLIKPILEEYITEKDKPRVEVKVGKLEDLECDSQLMQHVLINLISNAVKYSRKKEKAIIEIYSEKITEGITYTIKDNGAGFDISTATKLFEVFQRFHNYTEFEGTGVGLAIVHRIITRHGGKIWAESETGKGAAFHFTLPAAG